MTYTREMLENMSDDEINVDLHCMVLGEDWQKYADVSDSLKQLCLHDAVGNPYFEDVPNYCSSWNDIMPLAVEYGITYKIGRCPGGSGYAYTAENYDGDVFTDWLESPKRAMACCLLMLDLSK